MSAVDGMSAVGTNSSEELVPEHESARELTVFWGLAAFGVEG